ncbi:MAG: hypothetical protein ACLUI3_00030 [Christensenellales bacterium]
MLCFQRRQGDSPPAKPLQEVDNMQEVSEGMNAVELQEFKRRCSRLNGWKS